MGVLLFQGCTRGKLQPRDRFSQRPRAVCTGLSILLSFHLGSSKQLPGKPPLPCLSGLRDIKVLQPSLSKAGDQIRKHFCWTGHLHISTHNALPSTMGHEGQGAETL